MITGSQAITSRTMRNQADYHSLKTWRIKLLALLFLLGSFIIAAKLFVWQVLQSDLLSNSARVQQQSQSSLPAARGAILASDGFPLATTGEAYLLWASLKDIEDVKRTAGKLAPLLIDKPEENDATASAKTEDELILNEEERLKTLLARTDVVWVPVKRKIGKEQKLQIESLGIKGIGFDLEEGRAYPEASMAAQTLGFVGKDTAGTPKGYFGLEGFYDLTLSGSKGVKTWEKDAFGNPIILGGSHKVGAQDGITIKTHIDRSAQYLVERHLKEGVEKYEAAEGTVVVMRPRDGAILAMAGFPAYDPAKFNNFDKEFYINPAIGESFEPGSIFKVLVMAAALDAEAVMPEDKCDSCSGPRIIAEYTIESGSKQYYPDSVPSEIIEHSDNVGMIWVAERLGEEKMVEYLHKYGIGASTGIDLQGELVPPLRKDDKWGLVDLATASFGQGVAITPIQMVRAVGALANAGKLVTPQVVDKIIAQNKEDDIKPQKTEQVVSPRAAKQITDMMVNGVESKSDMWPIPRGFQVAGKTGTAQIPVAGHYDPNKVVSSFVGFAPANNPKFVMIVSLKDPKVGQFASQNAAFVWFNIADDLLPYFGAQPN